VIRGLIEIGLAVALAMPAGLFCAQADNQAQQSLRIPGQTLEVLGGLDERIRLDRSVMEFSQEFSLFDDQLYGRLDNGDDQRKQIEELHNEIDSANDRLAQANYALISGGDRFDGVCPTDLPCTEQEIRAEVGQLESKLASMKDQMSGLAIRGLLSGQNVVLEISRWDDPMACGATRDILELIDNSIESARSAENSGSGADEK
jgi:hypothetical protein